LADQSVPVRYPGTWPRWRWEAWPVAVCAQEARNPICSLAAIIFAGLPWTAAWALGLLVGINMLFGGSALIAMAMPRPPRHRRAVPKTA
jgi:hypothetical protein